MGVGHSGVVLRLRGGWLWCAGSGSRRTLLRLFYIANGEEGEVEEGVECDCLVGCLSLWLELSFVVAMAGIRHGPKPCF